MRHTSTTRGFTLLEVLVALLIFSFGVLGMAGLLAVSVKTNHSAYLRTQAAFLAQSMANRMRANVSLALWNDLYNGNWSSAQAGAGTCQSAACGYAAIATRDIGVWTTQVARMLPHSSESIACGGATAVPASSYQWLPPYSGTCTITLTWSEAAIPAGAASPDAQTFAWVFQP